MSGMFIVKKSFILATLLAPLLAGTLLWWYYTDKQFRPLSKFVSLSSVHEVERGEVRYDGVPALDEDDRARGEDDEVGAPGPRPARAVLELVERAALADPCAAEAPAREADGDPGDLRMRSATVVLV